MQPGMKQCRGYPLDHECPVMIPAGKEPALCHGCSRSRDEDQRRIRAESASMPSVAEVLGELPAFVVVDCPCGGDRGAPYHEQSLLHLRWVQSQGPAPVGDWTPARLR